jgi:hypothetical protein
MRSSMNLMAASRAAATWRNGWLNLSGTASPANATQPRRA